MDKKTIKKYAHELLKSMSFWTDDLPGWNHRELTPALPIKGKRARLLMSDVAIDYINGHIRPLSSFYSKEERVFDDNARYRVTCYVGNNLIPNEFLIHKML